MPISDHWSTVPLLLYGSILSLHSSRIFVLLGIRLRILLLTFMTFIMVPDPAFHSDADPDPASQNDADPCGSGSATLEVSILS
jgi:hypothetical protein